MQHRHRYDVVVDKVTDYSREWYIAGISLVESAIAYACSKAIVNGLDQMTSRH